jgi:hypothetical protein
MTRPTEAEFEKFIKLVRAHSDLFSASDSTPVEELPPRYTREMKSHAVYRWLHGSEAYTQAAEIFARRKPSVLGPRWTALEELTFVDAIVTWAHGTFMAVQNDWKPPIISVAQRRKTLHKVNDLLRDVEDGVDLEDIIESIQLRRLLFSFRSELRKPRKRDYSGVGARERYYCIQVGKALASVAGLSNEAAAAILEHFADLVGLRVSHRSAQRYMQIASAKHAQLRRKTRQRLTTGKS